MGSDLKNSVILEFYGLPGCGKSSVSHIVADELTKRGRSVEEPTYKIDHNESHFVRKLKKTGCLIRYFFGSPKSCRILTKLVRKNGYKGASAFSNSANIAQKLLIYGRTNRDFVIFDQGLTQSALSLSQTGKVSVLENEAVLYELCKGRTVKKIYLRVEKEEALRRMKGRASNDSRVEKMRTEKEQINALSAWESLCDSISPDIVIESRDAAESAAEILEKLQ